jgi:asparagine synthase (glutamine-hydrolysing)
MCGINGIFAYHYAANPIEENELICTRDHMATRGPDAEGAWIAENRRVGLGHRRLSIIDLSNAGAQPMASSDGRLVITFNGEIYNFRELRRNLEAKGHRFRSQSDTEVLLHLYSAKGPDMVHDLRGMFAFAIWDRTQSILFLARDPYGIKPLYYADDGWTFRFASQVKALTTSMAISSDPEPAGYVGFYLFGSIPEPFTLYREIRALPAGSTLVVKHTGAQLPLRYHAIAQVYCDAEALRANRQALSKRADILDESRQALLDSVRHHLVADVPVGAFLSSGIDSASLVGLMRDATKQDIQTITLSFEEFRGRAEDEAPLAADIAKLFGTRHTTRIVTESEFEAELPSIYKAMDQPSIDGINTWFVTKAAREIGLKVAISGLGGDELFGGYPSFQDIPNWVRLLGIPSQIPLLGKASRLISKPVVRIMGGNPKSAGLIEFGGTYAGAYMLRRGLFMPWELSTILDPDTIEQGLRRLSPIALINQELKPRPRMPRARLSALESGLYMKNQLLRDTDWASMAHSVEVRTPLVDVTLLTRLANASVSSELILTKTALAAAPSIPLPDKIRRRRKTGFMTPVATWQKRRSLGNSLPNAEEPDSTSKPWARVWARKVLAAVRAARQPT